MGKKDINIIVDVDDMEGETFTATVEEVQVGKSNPDYPDQIYITLNLNVEWQDEPWSLFVPYNPKKRSVWGTWTESLKTRAKVKITDVKDLEGLNIKFERMDIKFGDFTAKKNFPVPIEVIDE